MSAIRMKYILLDLQSDKDIAIIKINRPDVLNALNKEVMSELSTAIDIVGADGKIKEWMQTLIRD
jgi:enoyl-CoA hydratase/carnithine racemase